MRTRRANSLRNIDVGYAPLNSCFSMTILCHCSSAKGTAMVKDHFQPKLGRIRDAKGRANFNTRAKVFRQAGKAGVRAVRLRSHVLPSSLKRGMGTGALAAAGLI